MNFKKLMAGTLAATMVVGSSMTVLADGPSATGAGSAFNHVDKEVLDVTLPTSSDVANVFNYYVDPERAINSAGTLTDGTAVTANTDGVYFANAGTAAVPGKDASVTSFSIGGATTVDAEAGEKVEVPANTAGGTYTYTASVVTEFSFANNGDPITETTGADVTVTVTGAADGTYTFDGTSSKWLNEGTEINPNIAGTEAPSPEDSDTIKVESVWKNAEGDVVVPDIVGLTPAADDTIVVAPAVAEIPAGAASYSSSSEAVNFEGQNSVDVDVSVTAAVTAGAKDIALVADEAALTAATGPALLMTLTVGNDSKAITSAGATAKEKIAGKPNNFAVTADTAEGEFVYGIRENTDTANGGTALEAWDSTTVQLSGKTNEKDIPDGMTAPQIALTWSVAKHTEAASTPETPEEPEETTRASAATASGASDILVRLVAGQNANASRITAAKVNGEAVPSGDISVSGSGNVWLKGVASEAGTYNILITYDGTTYSATLEKK